jgi:phospholipid/cholesterol/gamma-HCH transport system permease protein
VVFAFIITSVSGYFGYYTKGGALEVGESSTRAVVVSSVSIIIFNLILTNLLLA